MSSGKTITYIERLAYDRWVLNGRLGYRVYVGYAKNEVKRLYLEEWNEFKRNKNGKRHYISGNP